MKTDNYLKEDFADFAEYEFDTAIELLIQYKNKKETFKNFYHKGVKPFVNKDSGKVFLSNSEYQVLMLNPEGNLEEFYSCPECGFEGFQDELVEDGNDCCREYIKSYE